MTTLLHYEFLAEFKRQFYKDLITDEHQEGGQIKLNKLEYPDGSVDDEANFWGYIFEKEGIKYLLSCKDKASNEIKLVDVLPLYPRNLMKVANKGQVYFWIKKPVSAKIRPEKTQSFKEFVDKLSSMEHSNPTHQKLMWFITLAQVFDRANFRIATPAGFGKDSTVEIINSLVGKADTIENPTLAKIEFMSMHNKLIAVNEVIDIKKSDWRIIEQFLLAAGAHKPQITKHSRAIAGGVTEILDISNLSLSLMYNDIDHYPDASVYFDAVTKEAVIDRFPAMRLYGGFNEDFNSIRDHNILTFVDSHYDEYRELISNYEFFRVNYTNLLHGYDTSLLRHLPKRWKTNIGRLLNIVDLYCDTEEEFKQWVDIVNATLTDYEDMLVYPTLTAKAHKELSGREFEQLMKEVKSKETFTEKNIKIKNYLKGERAVVDVAVHDIW